NPQHAAPLPAWRCQDWDPTAPISHHASCRLDSGSAAAGNAESPDADSIAAPEASSCLAPLPAPVLQPVLQRVGQQKGPVNGQYSKNRHLLSISPRSPASPPAARAPRPATPPRRRAA